MAIGFTSVASTEIQEKEELFHRSRKMFYLNDYGVIKFIPSSNKKETHAKWFSDHDIPFLGTMRGYYKEGDKEKKEESFIMIYINDFEVPSQMATGVLNYLFEYFPSISFIGLGAIRGERGDIWKPRLVIRRND